jgi:hypothetical protein
MQPVRQRGAKPVCHPPVWHMPPASAFDTASIQHRGHERAKSLAPQTPEGLAPARFTRCNGTAAPGCARAAGREWQPPQGAPYEQKLILCDSAE